MDAKGIGQPVEYFVVFSNAETRFSPEALFYDCFK